MKIAIQGDAGSFHHQAVTQHFDTSAIVVPCQSFGDVFGAMNRFEVDTALVAIENSLYGSINEVYDLIESHRYPITGEVYLRVEQQLIGLPGASLQNLSTVYSHPVALAQCEQYLDVNHPDIEKVSYHDTAAAVEFIKNQQRTDFAAIASQLAADLHGLEILDAHIEDNKANYTRFVVLSRTEAAPHNENNKTSLVLETNHQPGALARILSIFADNGVNMTKLQSRPIVGKVWKYRFYVDIEVAGPSLHNLLKTIKDTDTKVTILGEYTSDTLTT